jgi:hypothetical protein
MAASRAATPFQNHTAAVAHEGSVAFEILGGHNVLFYRA